MIDFNVAFDKLAGLETADEIAGLLMDYNIKANVGAPRTCAISIWMTELTGLPISTTMRLVRVVSPIARDAPEEETSSAMADFIRKFDGGGYPELVSGTRIVG